MTALADPTTTPGYSYAAPAGTGSAVRGAAPAATKTLTIEAHPSPRWLSEVEDRLNDLLALGADWDTYGASPIEIGHIVGFLRLLAAVVPVDASAPWIVPTAARGVQMEWHLGDVEVEGRVDDEGVHLFVLDHDGEAEGDPDVRRDLAPRAARAIVRGLASTA